MPKPIKNPKSTSPIDIALIRCPHNGIGNPNEVQTLLTNIQHTILPLIWFPPEFLQYLQFVSLNPNIIQSSHLQNPQQRIITQAISGTQTTLHFPRIGQNTKLANKSKTTQQKLDATFFTDLDLSNPTLQAKFKKFISSIHSLNQWIENSVQREIKQILRQLAQDTSNKSVAVFYSFPMTIGRLKKPSIQKKHDLRGGQTEPGSVLFKTLVDNQELKTPDVEQAILEYFTNAFVPTSDQYDTGLHTKCSTVDFNSFCEAIALSNIITTYQNKPADYLTHNNLLFCIAADIMAQNNFQKTTEDAEESNVNGLFEIHLKLIESYEFIQKVLQKPKEYHQYIQGVIEENPEDYDENYQGSLYDIIVEDTNIIFNQFKLLHDVFGSAVLEGRKVTDDQDIKLKDVTSKLGNANYSGFLPFMYNPYLSKAYKLLDANEIKDPQLFSNTISQYFFAEVISDIIQGNFERRLPRGSYDPAVAALCSTITDRQLENFLHNLQLLNEDQDAQFLILRDLPREIQFSENLSDEHKQTLLQAFEKIKK